MFQNVQTSQDQWHTCSYKLDAEAVVTTDGDERTAMVNLQMGHAGGFLFYFLINCTLIYYDVFSTDHITMIEIIIIP
jgi:hypothetical protein